jgi:hypothetical protein
MSRNYRTTLRYFFILFIFVFRKGVGYVYGPIGPQGTARAA